jgi:malonate transporter and related proteins
MFEIVGLVLPFFGLIFIGYGAARLKPHSAEALDWLNTFIVYIALPSLFYRLVARTPLAELTRMDFILANVAATYSVFILVFVIGLYLRKASMAEATIQALAGSYGNIGYMGPGLALLALGEKAAVPVALIFCFENMLHFSVTPALMALAGRNAGSLTQGLRDVTGKILFHPFILATIVGFLAAATGFEAPLPIQRLIDMLAQAAAPCALFAMGVTLAMRPLRRVPVELVYIVPIKLLLLPLVMYVFLSLAGHFDPVWTYTAVLLASLPTATNVFVLGQQYNVWQERASASVLVTTVLSVVTVSTTLYLIRSGTLVPDILP